METVPLEARRVYDPALRIIHAANAAAIVALLATAWSSELFEHGPLARAVWQAHIWLGYGLIVGLVARIAWGIVGPRHARFADLWHPRAWLAALRLRFAAGASRFGHDPLASLAYLAVYLLVGVMAATGLALAAIEQDAGPLTSVLGDMAWRKDLFKEPHEAIATGLAVFIGVHLTMLVVHQWRDRNRIAGSMVTGIQYRRRDEARHA